jgi:RNA exonuclease 4
MDVLVKPDKPVVSYLTALTGLTRDTVEARGVPLADALAQLRACLPNTAVLVGQNILQDVQWLGLREGADYASCMDLAGLYRIWNPQYNRATVYSQDHLVKVLLGWDLSNMQHNAALDALKSVKLFNLYQQMQADQPAWEAAKQALLDAPPTLSFARQNPSYEGECESTSRGGAAGEGAGPPGWAGCTSSSNSSTACTRTVAALFARSLSASLPTKASSLLLLCRNTRSLHGQPQELQLWGSLLQLRAGRTPHLQHSTACAGSSGPPFCCRQQLVQWQQAWQPHRVSTGGGPCRPDSRHGADRSAIAGVQQERNRMHIAWEWGGIPWRPQCWQPCVPYPCVAALRKTMTALSLRFECVAARQPCAALFASTPRSRRRRGSAAWALTIPAITHLVISGGGGVGGVL